MFGINKWVKLIQYFCARLDYVRIFHLRKLQFIRRISSPDSGSVTMDCVSYDTLSKMFSDMMTVYALDFMKLSCANIRDVVFDAFGGT